MFNFIGSLKRNIKGAYRSIDDWYIIYFIRMRSGRRDFQGKSANLTPLTDEQKKDVISFWKPYYNIKKELYWYDFYNTYCEDKQQLKYYIPDSVYYAYVDAFYTNPHRSIQLDDKNLYDLFFHDARMPKTILHKTNGVLLDKDYHEISIEQAIEVSRQFKSVITKRAVESEGGKGICFFDFDSTSDSDYRKWLEKNDNYIVQEVIQQHQSLNKIHDKSINTIRIMTMVRDGKVIVVSSALRMGVNDARVDNASNGGIVCGIDENGCLKEKAYDFDGNGFTQHPQGVVFKGYPVEGYFKCCDLAKSLAGRLVGTTKLVSWDFAVGADGEPILIEVNLTFGGVYVHQIGNGPVFGPLTETVLQEVFLSKR